MRYDIEAARRDSLAVEEAHRIRAVESAVRASSSRYVAIEGGTADSAAADEDSTKGVHTIEVVGFWERNPPAV